MLKFINMNRKIILFLAVDIVILLFGVLNLLLLIERPGLPTEYKADINSFTFDLANIYTGERIIEFDGKKINMTGLIDYYLLSHNINDTVKIKSISKEKIIERIVTLPPKFHSFDLIIMSIVTLFYFFTGIFILLKFRDTSFSYIIHILTVATGVMVIYDWGNLITYNNIINFIILTVFEAGIFFVPSLFLHFSFTYPVSGSRQKFIFLVPFYSASITFLVINIINLAGLLFFDNNISNSYFLVFHTDISDIFLSAGLIMTIAKLEHSALTISDPIFRKKIYWALLGISFGPLIYVFLRLIPRLLLGYELVSQSLMEATTIIAPIMLLISVTRNNKNVI